VKSAAIILGWSITPLPSFFNWNHEVGGLFCFVLLTTEALNLTDLYFDAQWVRAKFRNCPFLIV
jgi:hypothetical protein